SKDIDVIRDGVKPPAGPATARSSTTPTTASRRVRTTGSARPGPARRPSAAWSSRKASTSTAAGASPPSRSRCARAAPGSTCRTSRGRPATRDATASTSRPTPRRSRRSPATAFACGARWARTRTATSPRSSRAASSRSTDRPPARRWCRRPPPPARRPRRSRPPPDPPPRPPPRPPPPPAQPPPPSTTPAPPPTTTIPGTRWFGTREVGSQRTNNTADNKRLSPFTLAESGRVVRLVMLLASPTGGSQRTRPVIYADAGGVPGALIAVGPETVVAASPDGEGVPLAFSPPVALPPGTYWLGTVTGATSGATHHYIGTTPRSRVYGWDPYGDGASNPAGAMQS